MALRLIGRVEELCRLGPFRLVEATSAVDFAPPDGIRLEVPAGAAPTAPAFRLRLRAEAMCNFVHGIMMVSVEGGIRRQPPAEVPGFADRIDYRVRVVFPVGRAGAGIALSTDRPPARVSVHGNPPAAGEIELLVERTSAMPAMPLLAGVYADELRLVIGEP